MQRFFIPPNSITDEHFVIRNPETVHQIHKVLRMREGQNILLLDNSGFEFLSEIQEMPSSLTPQFTGGEIKLKILDKRENQGEPAIQIKLFQALPKNQSKFEEIIQHATEVGVMSFTPIICERSENKKLRNPERLHKIIQEAAEQSERGKIPELLEIQKFQKLWDTPPSGLNLVADSFIREPLLKEFLPTIRETKQVHPVGYSSSNGVNPIGYPSPESNSTKPALSNGVNIFIGPEGGFSEKEIQLAVSAGAKAFSLGPRILRTETAGVAIASAILFS